jgi:Formyl transferase, C-terminal domain
MKLLSVVHDEWSAAITDRLADSGLVGVVAPTDYGAERLWGKCPMAARLGQIEPPAPGAEPLTGVDEVLVYGRPALPDWISSALGPVPWFQVTAAGESGLVISDPVHWCLRHGQPDFRLRLHRSGADLPDTPVLAEARVELPSQDYAAGISTAADQLAALLPVAREAGEPPPGRAGSLDPLPLDRLALRIDWAASADAVSRLVRSGAGRLTSAWTYLNGYPVSIEAAQPVRMAPSTVAPGTVIRGESSGVIVQTGSGMVRVSQIRDALGPLPMTAFRPGLRLGIDHDEELRTLRRRVADLECTVMWLLSGQGADPGGPEPPSRPMAQSR